MNIIRWYKLRSMYLKPKIWQFASTIYLKKTGQLNDIFNTITTSSRNLNTYEITISSRTNPKCGFSTVEETKIHKFLYIDLKKWLTHNIDVKIVTFNMMIWFIINLSTGLINADFKKPEILCNSMKKEVSTCDENFMINSGVFTFCKKIC